MNQLIKTGQRASLGQQEAKEWDDNTAPPKLELAPDFPNRKPSQVDETASDAKPPFGNGLPGTQRTSTIIRTNDPMKMKVPRMGWWLASAALSLILWWGGYYSTWNIEQKPNLIAESPESTSFAPLPEPANTPKNLVSMPLMAEKSVPGIATASAPTPTPSQTPATTTHKARPLLDDKLMVTTNRKPLTHVNKDAEAGYQAYLAGEDTVAAQHYHQAALSDPHNFDAWLGLAALAQRQGKPEEAATDYLRVLELDPGNMLAQLGLLNQESQHDPASGESHLKTLLAHQPEAAFLHEALGHLYAEQEQWPSAQQAYFQAFHLESKNPEYAFNLAVSLDQIGKNELALTYYQRALELTSLQGGTMDREQVLTRMAQLRHQAEGTEDERAQQSK